ncbi:MAG: IS66 family insertion sequence element accessory protein TnpB [Gammaproteobacteria bacterium]|nr:IS66 family insertion sequence element accessory protein TnpB [Gammaproteobacteria bacterium]
MWPPLSSARLWLYQAATDMRKSYDGLSALVRQALGEDPLSGDLFVFVNRRRTQMRVLYFVGDGFCLWSKRLERGQFQVSCQGGKQALDHTAWQLIVEGIDLRSVRRLKRYQKPRGGSTADLAFSSIVAHERTGREHERTRADRSDRIPSP